MKSLSGQFVMSVAGLALLTTAAYAQTPDQSVQPGGQAMVHHRVHHAHPIYNRHAYHTGSAHHAATLYNQAALGWEQQPLYDAAVAPIVDEAGVACVGGRGIGRYPNPIAYGESAATSEAGGQYILDRGYRGCFAVGE
jgi:hypothetical protein